MLVARLMLTTLFAGLAASVAAAMPDAKPGLWESVTTSTMDQDLPSNIPGLAKMPAAEKEKLQRSMSPQSGKPTVNTVRQCVTPEMIRRWDAFGSSGSDSSCRRTVIEQSAQRVKLNVVCAEGKSTGEAEFGTAGPDRVFGRMKMRTRTDRGETRVDLQIEARWISADCGALKPGERMPLGGS